MMLAKRVAAASYTIYRRPHVGHHIWKQYRRVHVDSEGQFYRIGQPITENFLSMDVAFAKVSPKLQVVSNNDLLCELIQHDGWAAMPEEYIHSYVESGQLVEVKLKEMRDSRLISLNVFFPIGKDEQAVYSDTIAWIVEIARSSLK